MRLLTSKDTTLNEGGFTLVEVLISLFIFALISAGTLAAMFQTFAAKDRLDVASAELSDIAAFRAILRSDINAMDLRPMRDGVGRSNPAGAARGQSERVRYIFRDGQFIRETLRHENPAQREDWTGRVLLENLEDIEVVFRASAPFGNQVPVDITVQDWTIQLSQIDRVQTLSGAIEFNLTDSRGVETVHLFELSL